MHTKNISVHNNSEGQQTLYLNYKENTDMPTISCQVKKCCYNKDGGCRLDGVRVEGKHAVISSDTMCDSFADKCSAEATNSCECSPCACDCAEIECSAENCKYNDDGYCDAKTITMGCGSSKCASETSCETFEE